MKKQHLFFTNTSYPSFYKRFKFLGTLVVKYDRTFQCIYSIKMSMVLKIDVDEVLIDTENMFYETLAF